MLWRHYDTSVNARLWHAGQNTRVINDQVQWSFVAAVALAWVRWPWCVWRLVKTEENDVSGVS
jgi:hypothetical protein